MARYFLAAALSAFALFAVSCEPSVPSEGLEKAFIVSVEVSGKKVIDAGSVKDIPADGVEISIVFTSEFKLDKDPSASCIAFTGGNLVPRQGEDGKTLVLTPEGKLSWGKEYKVRISSGPAFNLNLLNDFSFSFTTSYDTSDKFPRIPDEELLTLVQKQTFRYFWDYAHPDCGMARERLGSGNTVAIGGSGFGIMTLPVAVERGFITRDEAAERMRKILSFLGGKAERFHGAFPHWIDGSSGKVFPFSANDNGGDLVETAFLIQGLLAVAQYFNSPGEDDIRTSINDIWRAVEWDWYTRGQNVLYWHWSPDKGWAMNMKIVGWNEGLIVYLLAASSPTHPVAPEVYHEGWASGGTMKPGVNGPMFFAHYSFMGLDPRGLKDKYADYWEQNVAHARYNYNYCVSNPKGYAGYSADCWGLTASDYPGGYTASAPSNDRGTIAPTAAVASYPYLPEESLRAIRHFYYVLGDRLWGEYGFYDAFNLSSTWFAPSYIAIDQGPIVVMIENARSALLWNLFMSREEIANGLSVLGFTRQP